MTPTQLTAALDRSAPRVVRSAALTREATEMVAAMPQQRRRPRRARLAAAAVLTATLVGGAGAAYAAPAALRPLWTVMWPSTGPTSSPISVSGYRIRPRTPADDATAGAARRWLASASATELRSTAAYRDAQRSESAQLARSYPNWSSLSEQQRGAIVDGQALADAERAELGSYLVRHGMRISDLVLIAEVR